MNSLIADMRAVTYWDMVQPEWDGVTLPRPKAEHAAVGYEIQVRRVIVTKEGQPGLSDWMPIEAINLDLTKLQADNNGL
jgi:hypothetical protein